MVFSLLLAATASLPVEAVPGAALPSASRIALDTAAVLAWPLELQPAETGAIAVVAGGTLALLATDTHLYRRIHHGPFRRRRTSVFHYTLLAGDGLVDLAIVSAFAFGGRRGIGTAIAGAEALASVALTSVALKAVFRVPRPQTDPDHKRYFGAIRFDAFPSGHTMSAFATATVIADSYPGAAPWAYALASVVGFSVMKRGWHWPSDVLMGGALGVIIGRIATRVRDRRISLSAGPAGAAVEIAF